MPAPVPERGGHYTRSGTYKESGERAHIALPPAIAHGDNLAFARTGYWHLVIFPGLAISLVVLAANLLGDSLRDIWDPRLRK